MKELRSSVLVLFVAFSIAVSFAIPAYVAKTTIRNPQQKKTHINRITI